MMMMMIGKCEKKKFFFIKKIAKNKIEILEKK